MDDDATLVKAAQAGDRAALDALLRRHHDRIYALCRRMTGNDADALDATQEALIAVVRGVARFDGRAAFSTWVYRVATNACLDELRRRGRRPEPVAPTTMRPALVDGRSARRSTSWSPTDGDRRCPRRAARRLPVSGRAARRSGARLRRDRRGIGHPGRHRTVPHRSGSRGTRQTPGEPDHRCQRPNRSAMTDHSSSEPTEPTPAERTTEAEDELVSAVLDDEATPDERELVNGDPRLRARLESFTHNRDNVGTMPPIADEAPRGVNCRSARRVIARRDGVARRRPRSRVPRVERAPTQASVGDDRRRRGGRVDRHPSAGNCVHRSAGASTTASTADERAPASESAEQLRVTQPVTLLRARRHRHRNPRPSSRVASGRGFVGDLGAIDTSSQLRAEVESALVDAGRSLGSQGSGPQSTTTAPDPQDRTSVGGASLDACASTIASADPTWATRCSLPPRRGLVNQRIVLVFRTFVPSTADRSARRADRRHRAGPTGLQHDRALRCLIARIPRHDRRGRPLEPGDRARRTDATRPPASGDPTPTVAPQPLDVELVPPPPNTSDWPAQATDTIVNLVDQVRAKTTGPAITVARGLVFGLIVGVLGLMAASCCSSSPSGSPPTCSS